MIAIWVRQQEGELKLAHEQLEELNRALPAAFHQSPPAHIEGSAEQEILEAARKQKADLIVVGARSSTFFGRLFLGSTANAVLAHAPCSVLVVRRAES